MRLNSEAVLSDAEMLRVLAHPLRMHILGSLRVDGPATSAILARRLRTDTGQTSHHLRHLAKHGLVAEAPERGRGSRGRERWWKAAHDMTRWPGSAEFGAAGAEALMAFGRTARALWDREIDAYHEAAAHGLWSEGWQRVAVSGDQVVRTTPERLARLRAEIERLVQECDLGEAPAVDAETVLVVLHTYPRRAPK